MQYVHDLFLVIRSEKKWGANVGVSYFGLLKRN